MFTSKGLRPYSGEGFLAQGAAATWSRMRPEMMIMKMTTADQQYLCHDDNLGSRLAPLTPVMPNGTPRSINIVKRGLMQDMRKTARRGSSVWSIGGSFKWLWEQCHYIAYNYRTICITISHYALRSSKSWYRAWTCRRIPVQIALAHYFDISRYAYV